MAQDSFLDIQDLYATFSSPVGVLEALSGVSFSVARGEFVCLVGPSGCGKSTLLRIAAGLLPPSKGHIYLEGQPQDQVGRRVGLVFQTPSLLPWRTVRANIALPLELAGHTPEHIQHRTKELLTLVSLTGFEDNHPAHLSGGMAQRATIARTLAQNPEVLLLDEPFGALDALTREHMAAALLRIWQQDQRTVLMVTHSVEEAALLSDRVVVMSPRPGRVVDIIPINLPRPRSSNLRNDGHLQRVASAIRKALARG